jgi:hypothetical protein
MYSRILSNTAYPISCDFDRAVWNHELKKDCLLKSKRALIAVPSQMVSVNRELQDKERMTFGSVRAGQMACKRVRGLLILRKVP